MNTSAKSIASGVGDRETGKSNDFDHIINGRIDNSDYQGMLTRMYQQRLSQFNNHAEPLLDDMYDEATSTDMVDTAERNAARLPDQVRQTAARIDSYSMGSLLPSERQANRKLRSNATAKAKSAMITDAYAKDVDRRAAARTQMMQMTEQLQNTGTASITQAISQKQQRDAAYKQAKMAQYSQIGAIAGGMIAGPTGAAVGSAAGAYVGGN